MKVSIIGGGIAGLSAAWFAADAGHEVTVLEAAPQVGGKLQVREVGGVPVDVGAEAMLARRPEGLDLLAAVGLDGDRISPVTTSASVRAGGDLFALPARTLMGIPGDVEALRASGVLSPPAIETVAEEPSQKSLPPLDRDVSVGALIRYRMGDEVADKLVEPLLGGVYAGVADELSLRATVPALAERLARGGSLLEMVREITGVGTMPASTSANPVFASVAGGLGRLPQALATSGRFTVCTGVTVRTLGRTATGFALECGAVPVAERIETDAVIVAAPAAKASRLLGAVAPVAARELGEIESASVAIVSFAFDDVTLPDRSGLLVAAGERLAAKGVTLTSRKWPSEPGSPAQLRVSVGRHREPHALQFDDADLVEIVRRELRALLGITAEPIDNLVTRWGGGLPQYAVGHVERVERIRAAVAEVDGLAVCGAAYDGVGIPACIASARAAVDRLGAAPAA